MRGAIEKYGAENFKVEQLDVANSIDELNSKEKYYIGLYDTVSPHGYNLTTGGDRYEMTDESREKMKLYWGTHERSNAQLKWANELPKYMRGKPKSVEHRRKIGKAHEIPIAQYNKDGHKIATWSSMKEASDALHIPRGNICKVCKGDRPTAGGYIWRYLDDGGD